MKIFLIIFFLLNIINSHLVKSQEILSNIIVLVDSSGSYFKPENRNNLEETLKKVNRVITKATKILPLDMAIQFFPIKEQSIESNTICKVIFARKNLAGNQIGEEGISKKKDLKRFLNDCTKLILKLNEGKATDITGAIRKAVLISNSQVNKGEPRLIIILSDFKEERALLYAKESSLSLNDFSFALIYPGQLDLDDSKQKAIEVKNYAEGLKSQLLKRGAKNIKLYLQGAEFQRKIPNDLF